MTELIEAGELASGQEAAFAAAALQGLPRDGAAGTIQAHWDRTGGAVADQLLVICAQVLMFGALTLDDDFFELGASSVLAIQVKARADLAFGVDLPLKAFFDTSNVRQLAALVAGLVSSRGEQAAGRQEAG